MRTLEEKSKIFEESHKMLAEHVCHPIQEENVNNLVTLNNIIGNAFEYGGYGGVSKCAKH